MDGGGREWSDWSKSEEKKRCWTLNGGAPNLVSSEQRAAMAQEGGRGAGCAIDVTSRTHTIITQAKARVSRCRVCHQHAEACHQAKFQARTAVYKNGYPTRVLKVGTGGTFRSTPAGKLYPFQNTAVSTACTRIWPAFAWSAFVRHLVVLASAGLTLAAGLTHQWAHSEQ